MEPKKMYIDGEWVTGSMEKPFDVINPATGEVLAQVYESSVEDTRRAIAAAKKSFYQTREWCAIFTPVTRSFCPASV